MPQVTIEVPFNEYAYPDGSSGVLDDQLQLSQNSYYVKVGKDLVVKRRPAIKEFITNVGTNAPITGLYEWESKGIVVFASGGNLYRITDALGNFEEISFDDPPTLPGQPPAPGRTDSALDDSNPALFADSGDFLAITSNSTNESYTLIDGRATNPNGFSKNAVGGTGSDNVPFPCSHVRHINGKILIFPINKSNVGWVEFVLDEITAIPADQPPALTNDWLTLDGFQLKATTSPDSVLSSHVINNIFVLLGTASIEFFYDQGRYFTPVQNIRPGVGGMSPYSSIKVTGSKKVPNNDLLFFWTSRRNLAVLNGYTVVEPNNPFTRVINAFDVVSDARTFHVKQYDLDLIFTIFPTEGRTLCYDFNNDRWSEWTTLNPVSGLQEQFIGGAYAYSRVFNLSFFGSNITDTIYVMDPESSRDGNDTPVQLRLLSPYMDMGSPGLNKFISRLMVRAKSGQGQGAGGNIPAILEIRVRTDGDTTFSPPLLADLGAIGQFRTAVEIPYTKAFKTIQFEITYSGDTASFELGNFSMLISQEQG